MDNIIDLELPYTVYVYVDKIYNRKVHDVYLFDTAVNQRLISGYFDDFLKKYNKRINVDAKITLDGLVKYAVINMFLVGMNPIVIEQISRMKDINLSYCQGQAWEKAKFN